MAQASTKGVKRKHPNHIKPCRKRYVDSRTRHRNKLKRVRKSSGEAAAKLYDRTYGHAERFSKRQRK